MCDHQTELAALNTRVLVITFGTLPAVQQWMRDTCGSFSVLLDRERTVYTAYGLERSFLRSRSLKTRWFYFKAWLTGKKIHAAQGDDTSQLGGDFIVDKHGVLRLSYPSYEPVDRPPVADLLKTLRTL